MSRHGTPPPAELEGSKMRVVFVAMQLNRDGRPCGWGLANTRSEARRLATSRWMAHGVCYPGEVKGPMLTKRLPASAPDRCPECGGAWSPARSDGARFCLACFAFDAGAGR